MAVTPGNVDVGLTGAISKAPYGTAAPTTAVSTLNVAYTDSGAISEDGFSITPVGGGDSTPIRIWQNGAQVRTLRTSSEDLPTVTFTMLETNKTSVETYFGVSLTQSSSEGSFEYTVSTPTPAAYVADILDGAKSKRFHIPRGLRVEVGDLVYRNDEPVGYEVTIECELDTTAGYNFKYWDTGLKTA